MLIGLIPAHPLATHCLPSPPQLNPIELELSLDPRIYSYVSSAFETRPIYSPSSQTHPPPNPIFNIPALGIAGDLEKGQPPYPPRTNQEEGMLLRMTLVIVTALVLLSLILVSIHSVNKG